MSSENRISTSLLLLRIGVFIVMFFWALDKFINPDHAAGVYGKFYFITDLSKLVIYSIGVVELAIIIGFLLGAYKSFTYGAVLVFHAISTFSSYKQYLSPYEGPNLLFFAAWPMLAARLALFLLRDLDTRFAIHKT